MMKNVFAVVLFFIVFTASAAADDTPTPPGRPKFPSFPFPRALPPLPAGLGKLPSPNPNFQKCFQDFNIDQECGQQIMNSFTSLKFNVDAKCCQSIQQVIDDCVSAIFGNFDNPFFGPLLKLFCSSGSP
ncbi:conserved hypothetical protein [Ricinus communis]|uniref:Prolamin-like domain-containing protein n=1 Tax=Ricinus communis TaxID=3988 RepID=B9SN88_RICCO|nr:conserved hypothetical protein [Ricinus communis]